MLTRDPFGNTVDDVVSANGSILGNAETSLADLQLQPFDLQEPDMLDVSSRKLLAFRRVAAPLLAAVTGLPPAADGTRRSVTEDAQDFSRLIDTTIELNRRIVADFGLDDRQGGARWLAAGATAEFVAAHYRATGHPLDAADAQALVETLQTALPVIEQSVDSQDVAAGKSHSPLANSLKAMAPAASSIARFSFGRNAMELLAEVTHRLTTIAVEIASRLSGLQGSALLESQIYFSVLEVAGDFYLESHFAEMDRLLEMDPEERRAYVRNHDKKIPMEPVWESLELRLGMLEALATYLPLPHEIDGGST